MDAGSILFSVQEGQCGGAKSEDESLEDVTTDQCKTAVIVLGLYVDSVQRDGDGSACAYDPDRRTIRVLTSAECNEDLLCICKKSTDEYRVAEGFPIAIETCQGGNVYEYSER